MIAKKKLVRIFSNISIGLCIIIFTSLIYIWQPLMLRQLDSKIYDTFLINKPKLEISPHIVIVDIDEESLREIGQWPWPRYLVAELLAILTNSGAAAIGIDILLSEPDRTSANILEAQLEQYFDIDVEIKGLPDFLKDHDKLLAETIAQCPAVLAMFMDYQAPEILELPLLKTVNLLQLAGTDAPLAEEGLLSANAVMAPLPVLAANTPVGFINVAPDQDGMIRRIPLIGRVQDTIYPSLSLQILATALGRKQAILYSDLNGLYEIKLGTYQIPVTNKGEMSVIFKGPARTFPFLHASDVLSGKIKPEDLAGKIVFIGSSAAALTDIRATPYDNIYPGVEVHAAALDTILNEEYIQIPAWTHVAQLFSIILYGIMGSLIFGILRAQYSLILGAIALALTVLGSYSLFVSGIYLSPLFAGMTFLLQGLILTFWRFWREEGQKRHLRRAFSRYVSPEIVSRIVDREDDILIGEEREVSIMFTDLRDFTTLSEKLKPEDAVNLLNDYFTPMTALIRNNKGTLDKFIGDAIMAFWNAPLDVPDHIVSAVETAVTMQETMLGLNVKLQERYGVELCMGVGVHVGKAYVGNMGSHELLDYTIIGDNVNLASRLEGLCSKYGMSIIISGQAKECCEDKFAFIPVDVLRVKGKAQAVEIYSPLRKEEAENRKEELDAYKAARDLYLAQKIHEAEEAFEKLKETYQQDLYNMYLERCKSLKLAPLPEDWDGIWTFDSK